MECRPMRRLIVHALLALAAPGAGAITIDGRIEPGEWDGARHVTDFRQTQPLTGEPGSLPTQAWILAVPEGLAVAFRATQPAAVARTRQRVQRDFEAPVDRVNVMVDFNGDGRTGYDFTLSSTNGLFDAVITNESQFAKDWDGSVRHAVSEDADGWNAEILIPWHTAPMHRAEGGERTIGIYLDRVVGSTGERMGWPVASFMRPRFVSEFARIQVPAYSQSLLAITPYASALHDHVRGRGEFAAGADLFWKPNGQFQLTASVNPDFGQVESDDLVVNFSATETFFSDKRPFFTENQGLFNFGLLDDNSALIYTRRVGGPADDGSGAGDIDAAIKLNGSLGTTSYGVLAADERGDAGRLFAAARVAHEFEQHSVGALLTHVERPWLERRANVLGIDHQWRPTAALTVRSNLVGSDIRAPGAATRGWGATSLLDYTMADDWRQQWAFMHFDDALEVNDFGYLARNDFNYLHWELGKRVTDLADGSRYNSHDWQLKLDALDSDRAGLPLRRRVQLSRFSGLRSGGSEEISLQVSSAGWDDRLTRGHGALRLPPSFELRMDGSSPRHGNWAHEWEIELASGGLAGNHKLGYEIELSPRYFLSDALSVSVNPQYAVTPDWLVWREDNLIGSYRRRSLELGVGVDWNISARQELRLKLQAIGLDARLRAAWRVAADGRAVPSDDPLTDFSLRNLGLQVRYRYEFAPLSHLYLVYGRGGFAMDEFAREPPRLLDDALRLRDDEQLLLKLNYRFEI